jgi:uncharacterized membrane protein
MMKRLRNAFATGVLVLIPVLATLDILRWFFITVDSSTRRFVPSFFPLDFGGMGVLIALIVILGVGFFAHLYVGEALVRLFEHLFKRLPIIGGLYGGIKQFLETIVHPGSDQFSGAVLVEFPRKGIYSIGFRTGKPDFHLSEVLKEKSSPSPWVNVFVPCTPNPTSGFYLMVQESELVPLNISVQEAFKIAISMGVVTTNIDHERGRK